MTDADRTQHRLNPPNVADHRTQSSPRPDGARPAMSRLARWRNDAILIALLVVLYLIVFRGSFLL